MKLVFGINYHADIVHVTGQWPLKNLTIQYPAINYFDKTLCLLALIFQAGLSNHNYRYSHVYYPPINVKPQEVGGGGRGRPRGI